MEDKMQDATGKSQHAVYRRTKGWRRERGLSLLEVGIALALAAVVVAGVSMYTVMATGKLKLRADAQTLNAVVSAANYYVQKHQAEIMDETNPSSMYDQAVARSIQDLKNDGVLPDNLNGTLSGGQNLVLLVRRVLVPGSLPPRYDVKALVTSVGAPAYANDEAGGIVTLAGASAGFIRSDQPGQINGAGGGWREAVKVWSAGVNTPAPGHVQALAGVYDVRGVGDCPDCLYRKPKADPADYNAMWTDLNMTDRDGNSHNLLAASSVQAFRYDGSPQGADIHIGDRDPLAQNVYVGQKNVYIGGGPSYDAKTINLKANSNIGAVSVNRSDATSTLNLYSYLKHYAGGGTAGESTIDLVSSSSSEVLFPKSIINIHALSGESIINLVSDNRSEDRHHGLDHVVNIEAVERASTAYQGYAGHPYVYVHALNNITDMGVYSGSANATVYILAEAALYGVVDIKATGNDGAIKLSAPGNAGSINLQANSVSASNLDVKGQLTCQGKPCFQEPAAGNMTAYSDIRLKENLSELSEPLSKIEQLKGYDFTWKTKEALPREHKDLPGAGKAGVGVIAQEVEKIFPELVFTDKAGYKSVDYGKLAAPLIEALKALHRLLNDSVEQLQKHIAVLQQDDHVLQDQVRTLSEQNTALKAELARQHLDLLKLKYAIHQPLSAGELMLCGAACAP